MERPFDYPGSQPAYFHFTVEAPAHWASYLVNGDASSLEDDERAIVDRFIPELVGADCVLTGVGDDVFFARTHEATEIWDYACMVAEYSFASPN